MGKITEELSEKEMEWINAQKIFFVASAPLDQGGHVNCSPKGGEHSFRLLSSTEFVYVDYTGSGIETIAHLLENQRMCVMFCAFDGPPRIVRLHGSGEVIGEKHPGFPHYQKIFPQQRLGSRAFIRLGITRISSSCGYQVPYLQYKGERDVLEKWENKKGVEGLQAYRREKNSKSIDGIAVSLFDLS